jgi:hypothetical protein
MQKLRAFVEKGGVVLVSLENHVVGGVEGTALAKVVCNSADQVGWSVARQTVKSTSAARTLWFCRVCRRPQCCGGR